MHPLNLWPLPGRLGRTFQVTNKGLFFRSFHQPHAPRTAHPRAIAPSPHITIQIHTRNQEDAHTRGCTMGGRAANPAGIPKMKRPIGFSRRGIMRPNRNRETVRSSPAWRNEWRGVRTIYHRETLEGSVRSKSERKRACRRRESNAQVCIPGHRTSWQVGGEEEGTLAANSPTIPPSTLPPCSLSDPI
jgi:hypothetical protein